jgi:hypothetical protein
VLDLPVVHTSAGGGAVQGWFRPRWRPNLPAAKLTSAGWQGPHVGTVHPLLQHWGHWSRAKRRSGACLVAGGAYSVPAEQREGRGATARDAAGTPAPAPLGSLVDAVRDKLASDGREDHGDERGPGAGSLRHNEDGLIGERIVMGDGSGSRWKRPLWDVVCLLLLASAWGACVQTRPMPLPRKSPSTVLFSKAGRSYAMWSLSKLDASRQRAPRGAGACCRPAAPLHRRLTTQAVRPAAARGGALAVKRCARLLLPLRAAVLQQLRMHLVGTPASPSPTAFSPASQGLPR